MLTRFFLLFILLSGFSWAGLRPILGDVDSLPADQAIRDRVEAYRERMLLLAERYPGKIIINGDADARVIALTFDDGPDEQNTVEVLNILAEHKCKATFFFLAGNVAKYPEVVRRAIQDGHSVLNHGSTHPRYSQITMEEIIEDISVGEQALAEFSKGGPRVMRPPYGDITLDVLDALKGLGLDAAVLWSIDSQDWSKTASFVTVNATVVDQARPGDIVLLHSGKGQNKGPQALPHIIAGLKNRGFQLVTLPELLRTSGEPTYGECASLEIDSLNCEG